MKKLDLYLANLAVGYIKLHNLHWNVKGFAFKQVHEYLEGLYDEAAEYLDEVAELQKMQGVYPKASLKDYLELSDLDELESKDYPQEKAVELALDYLKHMKALALEVRGEADEADNFPLANMMEDQVEAYNKHIWFLESMAV